MALVQTFQPNSVFYISDCFIWWILEDWRGESIITSLKALKVMKKKQVCVIEIYIIFFFLVLFIMIPHSSYF